MSELSQRMRKSIVGVLLTALVIVCILLFAEDIIIMAVTMEDVDRTQVESNHGAMVQGFQDENFCLQICLCAMFQVVALSPQDLLSATLNQLNQAHE